MLTMDQLDRFRNSIDETSLALYQLTKALREDMAQLEEDIAWNEKMHFDIIAKEMTKKRDQMQIKLFEYDHLKICCDKAIENIKDTEDWVLAMK